MKNSEKPEVAPSPSVAFGASSLPEGAYELVRFLALCREKKQPQNPSFQKQKSAHFSSAAVQSVTMSLPPGGRCHA